jgi:hypothetical protein
VIAAAMAKTGIVLHRPVGSSSAFKEHADLPSAVSLEARPHKGKVKAKKTASAKPSSKRDERSERETAAKYEREERQREKQRAKEEAEAAKAREKRNAAIEKVQTALLQAETEHEEGRRSCEGYGGRAAPRGGRGRTLAYSKSVSKQTCERQRTDRCRARLLPRSKN